MCYKECGKIAVIDLDPGIRSEKCLFLVAKSVPQPCIVGPTCKTNRRKINGIFAMNFFPERRDKLFYNKLPS